MLQVVYCGTSEPANLARSGVPLFIPYHRLLRYKTLPRRHWRGNYAMDSGGYNHLRKHGRWTISALDYVRDVIRIRDQVGDMDWAAPMDWMSEADALAATGLTAARHRELTVANFAEIAGLWPQLTDDEQRIMPVLQGDPDAPAAELIRSYHECWDRYEDAGVDITEYPLVGLGSVCRQQSAPIIGELAASLQARHPTGELPLHGFGVKALGLRSFAHLFISADSMAWSFHARRAQYKFPGCEADHADCRNCLTWALEWHRRLTAQVVKW